MALIKEFTDSIKLLSDAISAMQSIVVAYRDGQAYLNNRHPDVATDLSAMCIEIQKTLLAMAMASSIVTNFRFTIKGSAVDSEPRRFNEAFIAHKPKEQELRDQINRSRGRCHLIGRHADRMRRKAKSTTLSGMFGLFGQRTKVRQLELAKTLTKIYDEDLMFHDVVDQMTLAVTATFRAVQDALGPQGSMSPARVKAAAKVLGQYADRFLPLESQCVYLAGELQKVIDFSTANRP